MAKKISELSDQQLVQLVDNRWEQSATIWDTVNKTYDHNIRQYKNEAEWLKYLPVKKSRVRANRIFTDMEAVINSLIASPPKPNIIPGRATPEARDLAMDQEAYFSKKYQDLNVKEVLRMGLRNLYFGRLIVLKVFWDSRTNDFNVKALDPRKIRVAAKARNEIESEFVIEECSESLQTLCRMFPAKAKEMMKKNGITNEDQLVIQNPQVTYKECWIRDRLICKYDNIILCNERNPYWDWDGILATKEEMYGLQSNDATQQERRDILQGAKMAQQERMNNMAMIAEQAVADGMPVGDNDERIPYQAYMFNHFDIPRKPYIFATVLNNENSPIGQTDFITQASPLQEGINRRKQDIDENAKLVNGKWKIDSSVMSKADAQKMGTEPGGTIYGRGVKDGVGRETGQPLPQFVFDDMVDSREEIDNIMAATSAFRGEREGQETKAGRLALIEQSFLRLNEMVQVVDYVCSETFNWFYHLAKTRYTEYHEAKVIGPDAAHRVLELIQDDFEQGSEISVIPGKTLPQDRQFRYQRAQEDVRNGIISTLTYLEEAGYEDPKATLKESMEQKLNPVGFAGITPEEAQQTQMEAMASQPQTLNPAPAPAPSQQQPPTNALPR